MIKSLFATPLLVHDFKGVATLNKSLKEAIVARRDGGDKGIHRSNGLSCWHSNYDMHEWAAPAIDDLMSMARAQAVQMLGMFGAKSGDNVALQLTPWAMLSEGQGDYAVPHTHPGCHFGVVYYVETGEPDYERTNTSGKLELFDPRGGWGQLPVPGLVWQPRCLIEPKPGRLVVFPAETQHMVHPFYGTGQRIAIALNAKVTKYQKQAAA